MARRALIRAGIVVGLAGLLVSVVGAVAWASTGQDGPTPPEVADPVGSNVSPHGGYSSTSNFCLQCHEVHKATGEYALLWKASVTATCRTCHGGVAAATGTRDPMGPGTIGTTSSRTAYDLGTPAAAHSIGETSVPGESGVTLTEADWSYGWRYASGPPAADATTAAGVGTASDTGGGLYCASCHTPHGTYGQAINSKKVVTSTDGTYATQSVVNWADGTRIWWKSPTTGSWSQKYIKNDGGQWKLCTNDAIDGTCVDAQTKDSEGQLVSLYGYKLLSTYPNHTYGSVASWGVDKYDHDQLKWCGACHPSRVDSSYGGTFHNHPTGCTACHGNPAAGPDADFPHTSSVGAFLKDYPDALCVTCHTSGSLP